MKRILVFALRVITSLVISKYKPKIIGITGSVGKTSTKESIFDAFGGLKRARKSEDNLNTELGAPLVFLKSKNPGKNPKGWLKVLWRGVWLLIKRDKNYPELIVAELGADKPGDIKYLAGFIKPDIAVVTAVGKVPVHVEFYEGPESVAREKEELLKALPADGTAILNEDDPYVSQMDFKGEKITFGFSKEADVIVEEFSLESLEGSLLKIRYQKESFSTFLSLCIGSPFAYVGAAVFAVGLSLQVPPLRIAESLKKIRPAKGRLYPIKGINESMILDGSYNAAPSSMHSALHALETLPGKRKIAVLGDMKEIGKFSENEHRKLAKKAAVFCHYIFAIGEWAEKIKEEAMSSNMKEENVFVFSNSKEAALKIREVITKEDLILVKGSQATRTERVVFSIMRDPERAEELLVRQDAYWRNN